VRLAAAIELDELAAAQYARRTVHLDFLVIGHRGAAGLAPEHTRPSFERALEIGVDMIELDVQLSRDGYLVVIHDRDLKRTTGETGAVRERTLDELKGLDTGSWFAQEFRGEPLLTLDQVFELVAKRACLNVEIKSPRPDWEATADALASLLEKLGRVEDTVVSSFEMGALASLRRRLPRAAIGVLWQGLDPAPAWTWATELQAVSVHPFTSAVNDEMVSFAHQRGLRVHAWTVNDEAEMERLAAAGIDGIISDFPDRVRRVRERRPGQERPLDSAPKRTKVIREA
jgi:glycerophosphoryl diester phosphodiesterase